MSRVGATPGHHAPVLRQTHGHLRLRVGALGDRVHLIELELGRMRHQHLDGREDRIHRAVAGGVHGVLRPVHVERQRRRLRSGRAGDHLQRHHPHAVVRVRDLLVDERLDVLVVDMLLAVGERLEAIEGILERVLAEFVAELACSLVRKALRPECLPMTSDVLPTPTDSGVMIS